MLVAVCDRLNAASECNCGFELLFDDLATNQIHRRLIRIHLAPQAPIARGLLAAEKRTRKLLFGWATVMQHKTQRPVQFELTRGTREAVQAWIQRTGLRSDDFLFPSRMHGSPHLSTRQYARILGGWVRELGLDPADYDTHLMRRTKATLIYRRTRNLRAVQLLLGQIPWHRGG